jgi:hypothetical protein
MAAIADCLSVWHQISNLQLTDTADKLIWKWTSDGKFTVCGGMGSRQTAIASSVTSRLKPLTI